MKSDNEEADTVTDNSDSRETREYDLDRYQKYLHTRPKMISQADTDSVKFGTSGIPSIPSRVPAPIDFLKNHGSGM